MPIFVSPCRLRAISKYYAHQEQSGRDKLAHLANQLNTFILAKLRHVLFALYFAMIALRHNPEDSANDKSCQYTTRTSARSLSQGTYGSLGTAEDIFIALDVTESSPLLEKATPALPTLNHTKDCLNWRSVCLLLMCVCALGLAAYLLWRQTQLPGLGYRLSLIGHDIWSDRAMIGKGKLLDPLAVVSVYFTHTESEGCTEDCLELLHRLQQQRPEELPYNFLIAGDCQAFEARGWQYESNYEELPQATSLVVAFVGNFSQRPPSVCQLQTAQALLLESLKRRRIQPEYILHVVGQAEAVQQQLQRWPRYAGGEVE
ncbi:peptidoglycan-recognition protein LD isoform X2 [Drosophila guanche]|uniref:peptidoglycan-recognition protein LD isoform X2 n=1 Tax=Drosophila guanche TaxID=7266 RepID=UPI001471FB7D|nr:peptidoglycan-recognition protein LD isoform X2 [Drosophila guanche]